MYAIVRAGGKQVKVSPGDIVRIEKPSGKAGKGDSVKLKDLVLVSGEKGVKLGADALKGVTVTATVVSPVKTRKVIVFKKKRTKQYRRTKGHRQTMVDVRIDAIEG